MTATDADRRATSDDLDPVDPPEPPFDEGDDGEGSGGWWSASPTWAKAVLAGGVALALLLVGALTGGLVARDSVTTYGPSADAIDTAFLQDMSVHHRQAVQMAVLERERTTDPRLAQLAFDMESSQTMQVGMMEGWLRLWDQPISPPGGVHMEWMGMPSTSMPGMATDPELGELRTLSGTPLDVRFLQLMLRHHEGGFPMLAAASGRADVSAVGTLADAMLRAQTSEAQTMRAMLAERGAAPLPSPTHGAGHGGMPMN